MNGERRRDKFGQGGTVLKINIDERGHIVVHFSKRVLYHAIKWFV